MTETPRASTRLTGSGTAVGRPAVLRHAILTGGATGPVVNLRDGGASGTIVVVLKAPANDSRDFGDLMKEFAADIYAEVVSGNADLAVEFE